LNQWYNHYQSKNFCQQEILDISRLCHIPYHPFEEKTVQSRPTKQSRISEEVCEHLKQSILLGQFKAGDNPSLGREVVDDFQVSHTPIQEALMALENLGFIALNEATYSQFVPKVEGEKVYGKVA